MQRYKIKADDPDQLHRALALAEGRTRIFVVSEKRGFIGVGELTEDLRRDLAALGVRVAPDHQYSPTKPAAA
jgi:hypothetical protein